MLFSFFNDVYLSTVASKYEIGTDKLFENPHLWSALETLAAEELQQYHTAVDPVMSEDEEEFAYEGLLPVIKVVLQDHFDKEQNPASVRAVQAIAKHVCAFAERVVSDISDINYIKCLCSLVLELRKACHSPRLARAHTGPQAVGIPAEVIAHLSNRLSVKQAGIADSPAKASFDATFKKQIELDRKLHRYVRNMRTAFCGENNVRDQLSQRNLPHEAARHQYSEIEGSDEALPLGLEFQWQVNSMLVCNGHWTPQQLQPDVTNAVRFFKAVHALGTKLHEQERADQERAIIRLLQVFRAIMHNEEVTGNNKHKFQIALADAGMLLPVASLLSSKNDDVVRESLAFLVAILSDGNKAAQDSLIEHFSLTREETFFVDVSSRIKEAMEGIIEVRAAACFRCMVMHARRTACLQSRLRRS